MRAATTLIFRGKNKDFSSWLRAVNSLFGNLILSRYYIKKETS